MATAMTTHWHQSPQNIGAFQRGAALFTALILLVALTVISLVSLNVSLLQLRMSTNEEARMTAFQTAQGAIDNVIATNAAANPANASFTSINVINNTNCTANVASTCTYRTVALTTPLDGTSSGLSQVVLTRLTDPIDVRTTSGKCNKSSMFSVESTYDKSIFGQGRSELVQGYMVCDYSPFGGGTPPPATAEHN